MVSVNLELIRGHPIDNLASSRYVMPTPIKQGSEFLVNATTAGVEISLSVAGLTNGGFVVAWTNDSRSR